jgi:hypothetical protein
MFSATADTSVLARALAHPGDRGRLTLWWGDAGGAAGPRLGPGSLGVAMPLPHEGGAADGGHRGQRLRPYGCAAGEPAGGREGCGVAVAVESGVPGGCGDRDPSQIQRRRDRSVQHGLVGGRGVGDADRVGPGGDRGAHGHGEGGGVAFVAAGRTGRSPTPSPRQRRFRWPRPARPACRRRWSAGPARGRPGSRSAAGTRCQWYRRPTRTGRGRPPGHPTASGMARR